MLSEEFTSHSNSIELSILMPCLNEAETLATCIKKARQSIDEMGLSGEVIVADNGSTDGSREIAAAGGARVIEVAEKGYGSALLNGIREARGKYIIMGDADDSYDFLNIKPFVEQLRAGFDLVMGNRFKGGIEPGAMPFLHRYLGNPVLTWVGKLFFSSPCGDFHCGLRGFDKSSILKLDLQTKGMEFASEMVVKATLHKVKITEVPTKLHPDGRSRAPHLRTWRDGWRHLRFLLLYSPRWLFMYPGIAMVLLGSAVSTVLLAGPLTIGRLTFDIHTLMFSSMSVIIGFQAIIFAVLTKTYAIAEGLLPEDDKLKKAQRWMGLEAGLVTGVLLSLSGIIGTAYAVDFWKAEHWGGLDPTRIMRIVIPSLIVLTLGCQIILSSFFLSILRLKRRI
ncbi:MAG: glycosyltransferase family 2 protein [Blastocatellia bacterium]